MVATPAGSTAYNLSVHGPILPVGSNVLALTPISAFRPRHWKGALIPHTKRVTIEALESHKRSISAVADHQEFRDIRKVVVQEDPSQNLTILFDSDYDLYQKILDEQFYACH